VWTRCREGGAPTVRTSGPGSVKRGQRVFAVLRFWMFGAIFMLLVTAPQGRRRPVFREFSGRRPWFWPCGSCPRVVWDSFVAPLLVQLVVAAVFRSCRCFPLAFSSVPLSWAWMVRCVVARIKCRVLASSGSWTQHRVGGDTVPASKSFRAPRR